MPKSKFEAFWRIWASMDHQKRQYRDGTRAARFLAIRDAILSRTKHMRQAYPGVYELACGPFLIHYSAPGALGPARPYNIAIWPGGAQEEGQIMQANKVANVDWDQWDNVKIISFQSGDWESELLALLEGHDNVEFMPRR